MSQVKRCRSTNFSMEEKLVCLNLIKKYSNIIESKRTDARSCREKQAVWEKVEDEFNAQCPAWVFRSKEVLKKFFENKKKETRRIAAEINETGGRPPNPIYDLMMSIINKNSTNGFDGDMNLSTEVKEDECGNFIEAGYDESDCSLDCSNSSKPVISYSIKQEENEEAHTLTTEFTTQKQKNEENEDSPVHWSARRRPRLKNNTPLVKKYEESVKTKKAAAIQLEILKAEKEKILLQIRREKEEYQLKKQRDKEIFLLQKESLLLDIRIKKKQLGEICEF